MRIDSHQHFWIFDPIRDSWIDESMAVIQRNFLPDDLTPLLKENSFDGCVAVQADQTEKQNEFLLDLASKESFIKGIVGWVDLQHPNIEEKLSIYLKETLMKGFRHVLQGEAQRDFMLKPDFLKGIGLLEKYGFTYDILILPDQLKFSEKLIEKFPNQKFVVDHIAKPTIKNQKIGDWKKDLLSIAQHENVYCKVSGMVTEADWSNWKQNDFIPYLDVVFEAFGTHRLMFGSDWPVCNVAGGYQKSLAIVKEYTKQLSIQEQDQFFGEVATSFYNLKSS
ncbi:MAG: amidohydrolase family protein [Pelobium sp.]